MAADEEPAALVSVVVPTHDRRELLPLTLRSILGQEDVDLEVIVVDDGSADGTAEVVQGLGDPRVRLIRYEQARGVSVARNRGLHEARGRWVGFCDDDDLWAPEKLSSQVALAEREGRRWACTGHIDVTMGLRVAGGAPPPTAEEILAVLPERNAVPGGGSGVIALADLLDRVGGFDPALGNCADWELWLRLAGDGPLTCVPRPLVAYRVHQANMSLNSATMLADVAVMEERHGIRASRAALHRYFGWWAVRAGSRRTALGHFLTAGRHLDDHYDAAAWRADLAYLARDTAVTLASRGRRRAAPRAGDKAVDPEILAWRAEGHAWVEALAAGSGSASSHA